MANTIVTTVSGRSFTVYPSMPRTVSPNTMEYQNLMQATGVAVVVNVTATAATPSITAKILGVDTLADVTWEILSSAAIVGTGTTVLRVRPGITPATNAAVADVLPPSMRIEVDHADTDSITYSVTAHLLY